MAHHSAKLESVLPLLVNNAIRDATNIRGIGVRLPRQVDGGFLQVLAVAVELEVFIIAKFMGVVVF